MSNLPEDFLYTDSHEWICKEDQSEYLIGITDHAQQLLGEMVYVDLPEIGSQVNRGDSCAVVESVKAASDIYAPISGIVVAVNQSLENTPELINNAPYEDGWLFRIRATDQSEMAELLNKTDYQAKIAEEA